jgi:hypothetical protein
MFARDASETALKDRIDCIYIVTTNFPFAQLLLCAPNQTIEVVY